MKFVSDNTRIAINLASNYANVALMTIIVLVVVPIYVRALGSDEWATVALCMTLQGFMFAVDIAISPAMLRDVARAARGPDRDRVFRRFLRVYICAALCVVAIAEAALLGWFQLASGEALASGGDRFLAFQILLIQFFFQFSNNAALGYWNGIERQGFANRRIALFLVAKHALALSFVLALQASALVYLFPFAAISAIEFFSNLRRVRSELRGSAEAGVSSGNREGSIAAAVDPVVGASGDFAQLAMVGTLGVLSSQLDRIVLAIVLPAEAYGQYFLISTFALSLLSLQMPIQRAFLPQIAASNRPTRRVNQMFAISVLMLSVPCLLMALVPEAVLRLWLRSDTIAASNAEAFRLILIGVALVVTYSPFSALLLAERRYRPMIVVAAVALLLQAALLLAFVAALGVGAAALAWLAWGGAHAVSALALFWAQRRALRPMRTRQ